MKKTNDLIVKSLTKLNLRSINDEDIIEYLNYRDSPAFEQMWIQASDQIELELGKQASKIQQQLKIQNANYREQVFKHVFADTGNNELAAYLSDDFGMINYAWWLGMADLDVVNTLTQCYLAGKLPRFNFIIC